MYKLCCLFLLTTTVGAITPGCALFTKKNANSALDAIQLGCVFASTIDDESKLADACGIARDLIPLLRDLVGQRNAARKAGVSWGHPYRDGGPDAQ